MLWFLKKGSIRCVSCGDPAEDDPVFKVMLTEVRIEVAITTLSV